MKTTLAAAKVAFIAAVLLGLMQGRASAAGTPIQGIPVGLDHDPGGSIAAKTTTGEDGKFVFANLKAGKYKLSVNVPQTKASISTSRSNIKHTSRIAENGVEVCNVSITLGTGRPEPVTIELTKDGGKITGMVVRADAPTKSGATPAQRTSKGAADPNHAMDIPSTTR